MRLEADKATYPAPPIKWKRAHIRLEDGTQFPINRVTEEVLLVHLGMNEKLAQVRSLPWMVAWLRTTDEIRVWPVPDRGCDLFLSS